MKLKDEMVRLRFRHSIKDLSTEYLKMFKDEINRLLDIKSRKKK